MKEILAKLICFLSDEMQGEKRRAFIENFEILLEKRDTSDVWRQFAIWVLIDPEHGVLKFTKPGSIQHDAIQRVAQLYKDDCKDRAAWDAAEKDDGFSDFPYSAAWFAANAAWAATRKDAGSSYGVASWVAEATSHFAWAAAREDAGEDAGSVWAAANAAWAAAVARDNTCQTMAHKLIELMKASPEVRGNMKEILALRDVLSKNVNDEKRGTFIEEFDSLLEKRDTSDVWSQFAIWMLIDPEHGVIKSAKLSTDENGIVSGIANLYMDNCKDLEKFLAAAHAAAHAAATAYKDADSPSTASIAYYAALSSAFYVYSHASNDAFFAARAPNKLLELIKQAPEKT